MSVDSEETYLIVMRNMFSHRLLVHRKYDLKVRRNYSALLKEMMKLYIIVNKYGFL